MRASTSVYLDAARFIAACVVYLGHASRNWATGDLFPTFRAYDQTAVIVFFIISGFVIAEVAPRSTAARYVVDRLTRLYAVAVPAALLTVLATAIVLYGGSPLSQGQFQVDPWNETARLITSLLFLNRAWLLAMEPSTNIPWWSISYEFFYYALFFALFYLRRSALGIVLAVLIAGIAGPRVIALLPLWLLGFLLHRLCRDGGPKVGLAAALSIGLAGAFMVLVAPKFRWAFPIELGPWIRPMLLGDYCAGVGFALTVFAVHALPGGFWPSLPSLVAAVRWLASLTFALYLFHFPIMVMICALFPGEPQDGLRRLLVVALPFAFVLATGRWCERARLPLRRLLMARFGT